MTYSSGGSSSLSSSCSGPIFFFVLCIISSWRRSLNEMWNRPSFLASCLPCNVLPAPRGPRISSLMGGVCNMLHKRNNSELNEALSQWKLLLNVSHTPRKVFDLDLAQGQHRSCTVFC